MYGKLHLLQNNLDENEKSPSVLAEHVLINSYREDWHFDDKSVDQTIGV